MQSTPHQESRLAVWLVQRLPFFYGWIVVAISALCLFMWGATSFWAMPVFVGPMHDDTGWSTAVIFAGLSVHLLFGAAGGLVFGRLADRRGGAARLMLVGVIVTATALICVRWVQTPLQFIAVYGVIGGAGSSSIRLVQATLTSKWFVARRGKAVSLVGNGGSLSALIMVPVAALLVSTLGWRDAWGALGIVLLVLMLPVIPLVIRAPEDIGLKPDNGVAAVSARRNASAERSFTLPEVVRLPQFWLLLTGILMGNFALQVHSVVMVPHIKDIGFSAGTAASALAVYGLSSLVLRVIWGSLADKYDIRYTIVGQAAVTALGALLLMQIGSSASLYAIIAFQGMVLSGFSPLQVLVWPEFFGRMHIGSIIGTTQLIMSFAGALGPTVVGLLFDETGSYQSVLWLLAGTWIGCAAVVLTVKAPARQRQEVPV